MSLKLIKLKRRAKNVYKQYMYAVDAYESGNFTVEYIATDIIDLKNMYNSIMNEISMIDPSAPKERL